MKNSRSSSICAALALVLTSLCVSCTVIAQNKEKVKDKSDGFCSENWSSDNKESARELREMSVAAGGALDVDAGKNGGIGVRGDNRSDILIRACVQAWGQTADEAKAAVASVKVTTGGGVRAEGPDESNYSVSFQILVPRNSDLRLKAHNGGISISNVEGNLDFETMNGGVHLDNVGGEVRGRTTNGGVNVELSGNTWRGSGLDVQTSNGGVHLTMPENYAANIETGTVNGGFSSDIPSLNVEKDERGRARNKTVNAAINGGGAPIKVTTTNGGVRISTDSSKE